MRPVIRKISGVTARPHRNPASDGCIETDALPGRAGRSVWRIVKCPVRRYVHTIATQDGGRKQGQRPKIPIFTEEIEVARSKFDFNVSDHLHANQTLHPSAGIIADAFA